VPDPCASASELRALLSHAGFESIDVGAETEVLVCATADE
jgi:hypothetical protein